MAYTELQMAASHGDIVRVRELLALGVAVNAIGSVGKWTPLHVAAGRGHDAVVEDLLAASADFRARDHDGRTPLDWAQWSGFKIIAAKIRRLEDDLQPRSWETEDGLAQIAALGDRELHIELERYRNQAMSAESSIDNLQCELQHSSMRLSLLEDHVQLNQTKQAAETKLLRQSLADCSRNMSHFEIELESARADTTASVASGGVRLDRSEFDLLTERSHLCESLQNEVVELNHERMVAELVGDELHGRIRRAEEMTIQCRETSVPKLIAEKLGSELNAESESYLHLENEFSLCRIELANAEERIRLESRRAVSAEEMARTEAGRAAAASRAFGR